MRSISVHRSMVERYVFFRASLLSSMRIGVFRVSSFFIPNPVNRMADGIISRWLFDRIRIRSMFSRRGWLHHFRISSWHRQSGIRTMRTGAMSWVSARILPLRYDSLTRRQLGFIRQIFERSYKEIVSATTYIDNYIFYI